MIKGLIYIKIDGEVLPTFSCSNETITSDKIVLSERAKRTNEKNNIKKNSKQKRTNTKRAS